MSNKTTTGTTLEVLAAYFAYGVDVFCNSAVIGPVAGRVVLLAHTPAGYKAFSMRYNEGHSYKEGHGIGMFPFSESLPILRPFSALVKPLADGTVPAVEVAKIQWPNYNTVRAEMREGGAIHLWERSESGHEQLYYYLHPEYGEAGKWDYNAAAYLRRHHFAVNLEPHQFIEKLD